MEAKYRAAYGYISRESQPLELLSLREKRKGSVLINAEILYKGKLSLFNETDGSLGLVSYASVFRASTESALVYEG